MAGDDPRTCPKGHRLGEGAEYCSTCGRRVSERRGRWRLPLVVAGLLLLGAAIGGATAWVAIDDDRDEAADIAARSRTAVAALPAEEVEVDGEVTYAVSDRASSPFDLRCGEVRGVGLFDGLTEFEVRDASGELLERGQLGSAQPSEERNYGAIKSATCSHSFRFSVPGDGGPYFVKVGPLPAKDYLVDDLRTGLTIRVEPPYGG